ncbi:MAG: radical SAM protein, partial [Oscillospiraceae bacterium]
MEKLDILSMSLSELETALLSMGEKKFRAKQIFEWLHIKRVFDFSLMTNISSALREKLDEKFEILQLKIVKKLCSQIDGTIKYLYELSDGNHIECVLMDYHHGDSICISTQVGCKMGCKFCASTIAGFKRNLTPSEMLLQIYTAEKDSGRKISSIVMMGIGEPLDNYDNVIKFLGLVSSPDGNNMSLRHLSLSTCGLVNRINEL